MSAMVSDTTVLAPTWDTVMCEYIAIGLSGVEVFGETWTQCAGRLRDANRVYSEHRLRNVCEVGREVVAQVVQARAAVRVVHRDATELLREVTQ